MRINAEPDVETAVQLAVQQYVKDVEGIGFTGKGMQSDKQQWFTFNEQKALTEALIRAWYIVELPHIQQRYKVLAVEREIEPIEIAPSVLFQARVDAEFQEIATGDYHNYSLKTCNQWNERIENSYKNDLQGVTELWVVDEDARRQNQKIKDVIKSCIDFKNAQTYPEENLVKIAKYFNSKKKDKQVTAVRFCYLVKGRMENDTYGEDPELRVTRNPLINGYKNITPSSVNYAHSFRYPNPQNKSGYSLLGKGWERFNVWEDMGIAKWFEMLPNIQPECEDAIRAAVVTPTEYFRDDKEVAVAMKEIREQEARVCWAVECMKAGKATEEEVLTTTFPHYRKHCMFHFGSECEYLSLCWGDAKEDPIGSGLYVIRTPHHEFER